MKRTEYVVYEEYSEIKPLLPHDITFLHSEELQSQYPNLDPREREYEATVWPEEMIETCRKSNIFLL